MKVLVTHSIVLAVFAALASIVVRGGLPPVGQALAILAVIAFFCAAIVLAASVLRG